MFTDMVGYTTLGQRDESLSLALVEEQRKLVRPILARHNGREVKTMGDAFLVEFSSALDAVRCAYDVQRATREFNISLPSEKRIHLRVGVHLGDIVETQGDISGDAVNVASRVEPLAEDGGVCLTQQVYDHINNKFELPLVSIGTKSLKNVSSPIEVYKLTMPWEQRLGTSGVLDKRRVAVIPLTNMISEPSEEYFADGMTEELISAIAKVRELDVISRTSVMQYKNKAKNMAEIGRELNVGTLLEGSVRKAGNRVRIAVQLIDANSDKHLWAENYDRTLEDVFSIQSEIAQSVASVLKVTLLESDRKRLEKAPTKDPEAHALYLKGRFHGLRMTEEELKEAARFYQMAIDKDPMYALAYASLAEATMSSGFTEMAPPVESTQRGLEFARRSLVLDPSLPEAHAAIGLAFLNQWDFRAAEAEYDRAIELGPNSARSLKARANILMYAKRFDECERLARRALELDPLSPEMLQDVGTTLLYLGHLDDAIALFRKVLEIDPEAAFARDNIGVAYVHNGMLDEGIESIRASIRMSKGFEPGRVSDLGYALGRAGRFDELRDLLAETLELHEKNHYGAYALVSIYASLGEKDKAFEWLEKGFEEHDVILPAIVWDFSFESLRSDPRMKAMIIRLGLG
jgi:adenylate cyclase